LLTSRIAYQQWIKDEMISHPDGLGLPFLGAVSPSDFLNDVVSLYTFDVFLDD
jgi:hypothetical protein